MVNAKYKARAEAAEAEITALRQQLAERDAEVERLNKQLVATTTDHDNAETRIIELEDERDAHKLAWERAVDAAKARPARAAALEEQVAVLRHALEPFAAYGDVLRGQRIRMDEAVLELWGRKITADDLRIASEHLERARQALSTVPATAKARDVERAVVEAATALHAQRGGVGSASNGLASWYSVNFPGEAWRAFDSAVATLIEASKASGEGA